MSGVQTSIELYDRVSAPLNRMMNMITSVQGSFAALDREMSRDMDTAQIDAARASLEAMGSSAEELSAELNSACQQNVRLAAEAEAAQMQYAEMAERIHNLESGQRNFNRAVQSGTSDVNNLLSGVTKLVTAYASLRSLKKLIDMSDEMTSTTARLSAMNDGFNKINGTAVKTEDIVNHIYAAAENARGSFQDMAAVVAKFGNNARDAFTSADEVIDFANLIQKQMTIAGASTAEASNAMLQLSQALGSGVLRGDELNSIFEQAPNLIQSIADYLDVPIGQIREMAKEGQLTADIVKASIFAAADDINERFNNMPMTWGQVWTSMTNQALMALQPVLDQISAMANSGELDALMSGLATGLSVIGQVLVVVLQAAAAVATYFTENWSLLAPLVFGLVAAIVAYNAVMAVANALQFIHSIALASTATQAALLVGGIIAIVAAIVSMVSTFGKGVQSVHTGLGLITGGVAVVAQFFVALGQTVANIFLGIGNAAAAVAHNMGAAFGNIIPSIESMFYDLLSCVVEVIAGIAEQISKLPFVEFDYEGLYGAADDYAMRAAEAAGRKEEYLDIRDAFNEGMHTFDGFVDGWWKDAFDKGAEWGDGVSEKISSITDGFDMPETYEYPEGGYTGYGGGGAGIPSTLDNIAANTGGTAANTAAMADKLDITSEDLKYLRDIAERDVVNRFTTAEITINWDNTQNISSDVDIDGFVDSLTERLTNTLEEVAEGVHK